MCKAGFAGDDAPRAVFPYVQLHALQLANILQFDRRPSTPHWCDGGYGSKGWYLCILRIRG